MKCQTEILVSSNVVEVGYGNECKFLQGVYIYIKYFAFNRISKYAR